MLNGIDPLILFQFSTLQKQDPTKPPVKTCECTYKDGKTSVTLRDVTANQNTLVPLPPIPIYLSEQLTGLFVDTENKNIDIDTTLDPLVDGSPLLVNQKALGSVLTVNLIGKKNSIGLSLFLAFTELLLDKLVSKQYAVTYINGAMTVFGGLIHGFSIDQNSNDDLIRIKLDISKGGKKSNSVQVNPTSDAINLNTGFQPSAPVGGPPSTSTSIPTGGSSMPIAPMGGLP